jgi:hypothetical protein
MLQVCAQADPSISETRKILSGEGVWFGYCVVYTALAACMVSVRLRRPDLVTKGGIFRGLRHCNHIAPGTAGLYATDVIHKVIANRKIYKLISEEYSIYRLYDNNYVER